MMTFFKILLSTVMSITIVGCYSTDRPTSAQLHIQEQNAETTTLSEPIYTWTGKYQAVIPCDNCDATLVELTLNEEEEMIVFSL